MSALTVQHTEEQLAAHLLADRTRLSLSSALVYLATRARTLSPLGAAEFLGVTARHDRATYDKRAGLAAEMMQLYRRFFPAEYAESRAALLDRTRAGVLPPRPRPPLPAAPQRRG